MQGYLYLFEDDWRGIRVLRTGEMRIQWCRFRGQKRNPAKVVNEDVPGGESLDTPIEDGVLPEGFSCRGAEQFYRLFIQNTHRKDYA